MAPIPSFRLVIQMHDSPFVGFYQNNSENGCLLLHKTSYQSGVCSMIVAFRTSDMCLRSIFILVVHVEP